MGMTLAIAIENIIQLRVKTRESMQEIQSDFLFKWKDQKSKITCEMNDSKSKSKISTLEVILNQNQKSQE